MQPRGETETSADPGESPPLDAELRNLVERAPDPIARLDRDLRYLYANAAAARLLGVPEQRMRRKTHAELGLTEPWVRGLELRLREAFASGALVRFELVQDRPDRPLHYDVELVPELCASGSVDSVVLFAHDVTAHTHVNGGPDPGKAREEFLAGLSHEIRNPLMPIRSSLYVLERAAPGGEQARRALSVIHRQVNQLTRLVDDLLDVARVTRHALQLRRERIELGVLLGTTVQDERPGLAAAGIEIEQEPAPEPLWVSGDPDRMRQIMHHLLDNAAKLASRGGRVNVTLGREGTSAVVRVRHTGAPLPPEVMARVFQPFADTRDALEPGVLGLGLALVRELTELHGGTVTASSACPNGGAELSLRLPLLVAPPGALLATPDGGALPRRVLVIEDNRDAASSLREALELMGYEVAVANDGPQGIELARSFEPAVVLCDIGLPGMDGYEVARTFRNDERLKGAVLVALTGHALPEDQRHAAEAGFTHHIAKPLSFESLERLLA